MFDSHVEFADIELAVDPIDRDRTEDSDNAMAIFYEEQPFMWEFVKDEIERSLTESSGNIDFLDVGTGSGIWALLVTQNTKAESVVALDKSSRAIKKAQNNKKRNNLDFELREEFYNISTVPHRSCKVMGLYPPYHLYPAEVALDIPQHARGGIHGQQVLKEQLAVMNYHLADNGSIVFNQMCLGDENGPAYTSYIPRMVEESSLYYTNILEPMRTDEFLSGVYDQKHKEYREETADEYPMVYYTTGWIRRDGKEEIHELDHNINLHGRSWEDRIKLHKEIAKHGFESNSQL